jgi:DNA-binding transcriptional LysR family regulator
MSATPSEPLLDPLFVKTFLAVAEEGSISAGARRVFRTQSTASTQIRMLEDQLGARLFDRDTRKLALTAEGERFVAYAERLISANSEALAALKAAVPGPVLRVGFTEYFEPERVAQLVRRLSHEWPSCRFELRIAQSSVLEQEFEAKRLDLVVVSRLSRDRGDPRADPLHWVSARDFALPARGELPLVLLPGGCALHALVLHTLTRVATPFRVAVTCSGSAGLHAALRGGLGLGCLNEGAIPADLAVRTDPRLPRLPALRFLWRALRGTLAAEVAESLGASALARVERA